MALRGVNIALAWIGVERIFIDVFRDVGFTDNEIGSFLSGPAFLAWNHFGNIQGSWGGELPDTWVDEQFSLQRKILQRMLELGITPILPAFPGFVPENVTRVWPNASIAKSPQWEGFPATYTNVTYLNPFDVQFGSLQRAFIKKQQDTYGNITHFWTLDQFNENQPASGDLDYLHNVSYNTWKTLKAADAEAIWVMQGWLFASDSTFWTNSRVQSFLDGVPVDSDMLILDLFTESAPQWQRTNSFHGKPWIWCQLHGYGGNMGLYGQIENVTQNSIDALERSASIVGFGLTMEGQEGNEVMYDLLLDQAWSNTPIDTELYFQNWVSARYSAAAASPGSVAVPKSLYSAWETARYTVYNNSNNPNVTAVTKSILELRPSISGLVGRTGHHPTLLAYDPSVLVRAWNDMHKAGLHEPALFDNAVYRYDLVDWTRQVLANAFEPLYDELVSTYNKSISSTRSAEVRRSGQKLVQLLESLDVVLAVDDSFALCKWIEAARATGSKANPDFFEYEARNQVTLWGPTGQVEDYASKQWARLVGTYYAQRWSLFVDYLAATDPARYNDTEFSLELHKWEYSWVGQKSGPNACGQPKKGDLRSVISRTMEEWPAVFSP